MIIFIICKELILIQYVLYPLSPSYKVPVQSWGLGLNYSVWYVELKGLTDIHVVQKAIRDLEDVRECPSPNCIVLSW